MKKLMWIFVFVFGVNSYSQKYKTELTSATASVDGTKVTMVFNNPIISGSNMGFTINNTTDTFFRDISGIGTNILVGILSNPIVYGEPININYKSIETIDNVTGDLQDSNGPIGYFLKEMVDVSAIPFLGTEKYVTVTGGGLHDGSSEANAYNITEMINNLSGGIRMNLKAGDYGDAEVVIASSGAVGNPIVIEGYTRIPGDKPNIGWDYKNNRNLDATVMPLFNGGHKPDMIAFKVKRANFVTVKNIQILNYGTSASNSGYGFYVNISDNTWFDNIIVESTNRCIVLYNSNNSVLTNSVGLNGWLSNISIFGNNNLFYNNESYCNLTTTYDEGTDYYYSITGNHNVFRDNYAKRDGNIGHAGHGLSIDANGIETAHYNLVDSHTTVNIDRVIEYRHPNVVYNVSKGLHSYGEGVGSDKTGGITIRDNAHDNIIDGGLIDLHNVPLGEGVLFLDSSEEGIGLGNGNTIMNVVFNGGRFAIISNDTKSLSATGTSNKILNCTFKDFTFMFRTYGGATMSSCVIKNTIIENVKGINWDSGDENGWAFYHCNFNGGYASQGANATTVDPQLDAAFMPNKSFLTAPRLVEVIYSKNGRKRKDPTMIGALEYQDDTIGSLDADAGSDENICLGESVRLTASGGATYRWSNGATTQSISVNPTATTTYTVTVSEGGNSDTDDVIVTVNTVDAGAGGNTTITEGESITLTARGGDSYVWNTGETTKSIIVSPTSTTIYTVTAKKGECEDTDVVAITVNAATSPSVTASAGSDEVICLGESVTLTATGGDSYVWSSGETNKTIDVRPTRTTIYTLSATRGGTTDTDTVVVTVENCNETEEEVVFEELLMYPNPTTGELNIQLNSLEKEDLNLVVMSMNGSIVYQDKMYSKKSVLTKKIDLSGFTKGLYFIRINDSNFDETKKILVY